MGMCDVQLCGMSDANALYHHLYVDHRNKAYWRRRDTSLIKQEPCDDTQKFECYLGLLQQQYRMAHPMYPHNY